MSRGGTSPSVGKGYWLYKRVSPGDVSLSNLDGAAVVVGEQQVRGLRLGPLAEDSLLGRGDHVVDIGEGRLLHTVESSFYLLRGDAQGLLTWQLLCFVGLVQSHSNTSQMTKTLCEAHC